MFQRLLVPLDGSSGAERAIPVAASLARQTSGSLVFLHLVAPATAWQSAVARPEHEALRTRAIERVMVDAASYLAMIPARYAEALAELPTEMEIAFGTASPTLPSTARLEHIDLIVLCRHQEAGLGQWGPESIAQQVMRHSPVPLLTLNEHAQDMPVLDGTHPLRVVVPLDGSLFAETALAPALHLLSHGAGSGQRELCLMHVVDLFASDGTGDEEAHRSPSTTEQARQSAERYLQAIADRLRQRTDGGQDLQITCLVTSGVDIASAILTQIAPAASSSLVAMATHGREGIQRLAMGSVAERLLNATTAPLLTVCPRVTTVRLMNIALPVPGKQ